MRQFWLFAGDFYYPSGGFHDFVGSFESLQDAVNAAPESADWAHVMEVAEEGSRVVADMKKKQWTWANGGPWTVDLLYAPKTK